MVKILPKQRIHSDKSARIGYFGGHFFRVDFDFFNTLFETIIVTIRFLGGLIRKLVLILEPVKGIKGGYSLNKSLSSITYMELVRMIEGREEIGRVCSNHKGNCELIGKCNISTPVEVLNRKLNSFLENLTLAELLQGTEFNRPKILEAHV